MNDFRTVAPELKRELGQKLNELKTFATERINTLKAQAAEQAAGAAADALDLTRTPAPMPIGTRHPLNIVRQEIIDIFSRMGFSIAEGPEIEDDWHVFSSLNFAADHPARDMQDTFFLSRDPEQNRDRKELGCIDQYPYLFHRLHEDHGIRADQPSPYRSAFCRKR